jgi:broad specificity phosphatase PhoE
MELYLIRHGQSTNNVTMLRDPLPHQLPDFIRGDGWLLRMAHAHQAQDRIS